MQLLGGDEIAREGADSPRSGDSRAHRGPEGAKDSYESHFECWACAVYLLSAMAGRVEYAPGYEEEEEETRRR